MSSWYRESLAPKIEIIQDAIELKKTIRFKYYAPGGDTEREIEPYYLIFKWTSWYVYGHCYLRDDFRLFKLNRMDHIVHEASFSGDRKIPIPDLSNEKVFPTQDRLKAIFDPSLKWQLVEEFGVDSFMEMEDGNLLFEHEYADDEGMLALLLSCRDKVTVLKPERIRTRLYQISSAIAEKYEETVP